MKIKLSFIIALAVFTSCMFCGCDNTRKGGKSVIDSSTVSPQIVVDTLIFDSASNTFALTLHMTGVNGADVEYCLFDGDSLLFRNTDGMFSGIVPLDEGYNVQANVVWSDTAITTPIMHVAGFVVLHSNMEKLALNELEQLITACDKSLALGTNEQIVQGLKVLLHDGQVTSMQDVMLNIANKVWKSVQVTDVTYDESNRVTSITVKPEMTPTLDSTDDNDDDFVDEF